MSNVKGSSILNRFAFLTDRFGEDARDRLLAALPAEDVALLTPRVLASSWYDFDLYNRIDAALCQVFGNGDLELCRELGMDSARRALSGTYRAFLKDGPGSLLTRLAGLHMTLYSRGSMEVKLLGDNHAVIRNVYVPRSSRTNCLVAEGFYRTIVEMCGGVNVRVTEGGCSANGASHCLFNILWS